jgi:excisionase family DNA binding protein
MSGISVEVRLPDDQLAVLAKLIVSALPVGSKDPSTYTVAEAARIAGCNVSTVRRQVDAGLLPKVQNVKKLLIPREALERWISGKPATPETHG